jgi:hypothetical protein
LDLTPKTGKKADKITHMGKYIRLACLRLSKNGGKKGRIPGFYPPPGNLPGNPPGLSQG